MCADRNTILSALEQSDHLRREARATRLEWLSLHRASVPVVMGRAETLRLLEEAGDTFLDGHFVASLLVALAFIEHTLVEELQRIKATSDRPTFGTAISLCEQQKLFPSDWLDRSKSLSLRRNAYVHLKKDGHSHSLGTRLATQKLHPVAIMEADAKNAVELMYGFFVATLREVDFG